MTALNLFGEPVREPVGVCQITARDGVLAVSTPYDAAFVAELKAAVPHHARRWDGATRCWLIAPAYGLRVASIVSMCFGETVTPPASAMLVTSRPEIALIRLEYLGACKERGDGTVSATGYVDGRWGYVFPEAVLKTWFKANTASVTPERPAQPATLYSVLASDATATADELKQSYRRLVRQWHPDVAKEPDAEEMFKRIQHAWDVLREPMKRKKYDAGLKLQASLKKSKRDDFSFSAYFAAAAAPYRAPLRCGLVLVEATPGLVATVSKILAWNDITNADGKTLVASWNTERQCIESRWV